jgi:hypothetical protein
MVLSLPYALAEAGPYFLYGALYMLLILVPHVLGVFGRVDDGVTHQAAIAQVETGLTLALPPLLLAGGVVERTAKLFWPFATRAQRLTPINATREFGDALARFHRAQLRRYLAALGGISAAAGLAFELMARGGQLQSWVHVPEVGAGRWVFWAALLGYALLGWGTFNCLFTVSLGRPAYAMRAFRAGILTTVAVGIPLCFALSYRWAGVAFLAGAVALVVTSQRGIRDLSGSAAYIYSSSF